MLDAGDVIEVTLDILLFLDDEVKFSGCMKSSFLSSVELGGVLMPKWLDEIEN